MENPFQSSTQQQQESRAVVVTDTPEATSQKLDGIEDRNVIHDAEEVKTPIPMQHGDSENLFSATENFFQGSAQQESRDEDVAVAHGEASNPFDGIEFKASNPFDGIEDQKAGVVPSSADQESEDQQFIKEENEQGPTFGNSPFEEIPEQTRESMPDAEAVDSENGMVDQKSENTCLLYTSPSPRD